ncbi:Nsp1-like C-terminal region-domain-containing protein [Xylaria scruposa]|nr:Nsp1-like C-terminal region-domain-containing protein [Xylaria scruposa]
MSLFGNPSSSGASSNNATTSSASAGGGLFGSKTPTTTSAGGLFGSSTTPATTSAGGLFGSSLTPAAKPSTTPATTGGLFGEQSKSSTPSFSFGNAASGGNSAAAAASSGTSGSSLFGTPAKPGEQKSLFGATSSGTASSSTTPAVGGGTGGSLFQATPAKPLFALNSTTPAGAPPANNTSKPSGGLGLFANKPSTTTTPSGSSLFPSAQQGETKGPSSATAQPTSLASSTNATTQSSSSLFPSAQQTKTKENQPLSLFGNQASSLQPKPATTQPTSSTTPATLGGGLFGSSTTPAASGSELPKSSTTPATIGGGLFKSSATPAAGSSTIPATSSGGGLFGSSTTPAVSSSESSKPSSTTPATSAGGLFGSSTAPATSGGLTGQQPKGGSSTTPTASGGLFGEQAKSTPAKSTPAFPLGNAASGGNSAVGASTSGPTSSMARLKNKTMDEILNRWATDLSKYQKEFKEQASQVAAWDRLLVENGDKIQKLYLNTFEAEKASREVERHLVTVESQQEELESWLDKYEVEVDALFSKQIGPGEQLVGPDQERERTYKLAEKITERLDEMGRDLTKMIKDINDISGAVSKGSKSDDPLSQIVRVLNGHLTQLQWIDTHAAALQAKVTAAQKSSSQIGSQYGGAEQDNVDSFYRSYMGRR